MKSINISENLYRSLMDRRDVDHISAEAVICGLINENDEYKEKGVIIEPEDVQEVFEILCSIPFEKSTVYDTEPSTTRHSAIEKIISKLQKRVL